MMFRFWDVPDVESGLQIKQCGKEAAAGPEKAEKFRFGPVRLATGQNPADFLSLSSRWRGIIDEYPVKNEF